MAANADMTLLKARYRRFWVSASDIRRRVLTDWMTTL